MSPALNHQDDENIEMSPPPIDINQLDFPVWPHYGKEKIRTSQEILLKMGVSVCSILERHGIPYFITNGTLVGAALYGSFVPWDDDFDLFLFDDTYDFAMRCLESELPDHLIVHSSKSDSRYFPAWNRVKNLRTRAIDSGIYNPHNRLLKFPCLSVDMYRIKEIDGSKIAHYKNEEAIAFFERKRDFGIIDQETFDRWVNPLRQERKKLLANEATNGASSTVYMFMVMLKRALHPHEIFPLKRYSFENFEFWGPQSSDAVLSSLYGETFKNIPKYTERKTRFSKVDFLTDGDD